MAIESLPAREQKVIGLYYYQEATMKQIGAEIGVNESRVSQLHARAIRRLREALAGVMPAAEAAKAMRTAILEFQQKPRMAKATLDSAQPGIVVPYASVSRTARSKSESHNVISAAGGMKLYVSIIAKEGRSARPVLVSSDPDLIAAIGKHLAERFGVELSAQIRMLPPLEPKRPEQQSTRPQTLGYALTDSPAGQCAWIVEKFQAWSDCDGHPENAVTRDDMLDDVTLYWLTATAASAARLYWESFEKPNLDPVTVPTGCSIFPKEIVRPSRRWVERRFSDLRSWSEPARGGHFAALEQPEIFVDEVRSFFASLALDD